MVGFLGTVTGMVKAFMSMAGAGANVDVNILSTGIYEALVTTVGGLIVGIIALFAYNYLPRESRVSSTGLRCGSWSLWISSTNRRYNLYNGLTDLRIHRQSTNHRIKEIWH